MVGFVCLVSSLMPNQDKTFSGTSIHSAHCLIADSRQFAILTEGKHFINAGNFHVVKPAAKNNQTKYLPCNDFPDRYEC